jgi:membrane protein
VPSPGSAFVDAMAVLEVLVDARNSSASAAVDATIIRDHTRLGFEESENLLEAMLDAGWVGRIKTELPRKSPWGKRFVEGLDSWTLLANPEVLSVADVYRLFVFHAGNNLKLAQQVEHAVEEGLNQTLADHFKTTPDPSTSANT